MIKSTLKEIKKQFAEIPVIHPIKDMKIVNDELNRVMEKKDKLKQAMEKESKLIDIPNLQEQISIYE